MQLDSISGDAVSSCLLGLTGVKRDMEVSKYIVYIVSCKLILNINK